MKRVVSVIGRGIDRAYVPVAVLAVICGALAAGALTVYVGTLTYYGVEMTPEINLAAAAITTISIGATTVSNDCENKRERSRRAALMAWFARLSTLVLMLVWVAWLAALPLSFVVGARPSLPAYISVVFWLLVWAVLAAGSARIGREHDE